MRFYLDGLDRIFEVKPIVIEGLNHAVNNGIEDNRKYLYPAQIKK